MEHNIVVSGVVGLVIASSLYVWNSNEFTKEQKTFLLIAMIFAPVQWIGILVIKYYNNHKFESTPERKTEKKLDSTISNLMELKEKGILTDEEYKTKVDKIEIEKTEQNLKNSLEYKQLKSLYESGVLTKEEFENKINLINNKVIKEISIEEKERLKQYVENIKLPIQDIKKRESSKSIYIYSILFYIVFIGIIIIASNFDSKDNTIDEEPYVPPMVATDTMVVKDNSYSYENKKEERATTIFVYATVDFKYYVPENSNEGLSPNLKQEGKTCTTIFEIRPNEIETLKQKFYSSFDVQDYNHQNSVSSYGYITFPETVEVLIFYSMDEANSHQMKNCVRTLSTFNYFSN